MAPYLQISINVYDSVTNAAVVGAMVYVNGTVNFDPTQFSVTTDSTGSASFQVPVSVSNGGNAAVTVTAANYTSQTQNVNTISAVLTSLSFPLVSTAPASVPITLQFQPPNPAFSWSLLDAGANTIDSGVSGNDGSSLTAVGVPTGSYTVQANGTSYTAANQAIEVNGQQGVYTINMTLVANPSSVQQGSNTGGSPATSNPASTTSTTTTSSPNSSEFTYPNSDYDKYFTITGARIYIGNLFIDEINMIQWALQDNAVPVFGYASRFYDALAQGRSLVQGQFALNFVSEGYLYTVMQDYATLLQSGAADQVINNPGIDVVAQIIGLMSTRNAQAQTAANNPNSITAPVPGSTTTLDGVNPPVLPGQVVQPTTVGTSAETGAQATAVNSSSQTTAINNQIAKLKMQLTPSQVNQLNSQIQSQLTTSTDPIGFANAIYQDVIFDIQIDFGNEITGVKRVRYLENCKLISNEMVIAPDGQTILDSYGFIARRLR